MTMMANRSPVSVPFASVVGSFFTFSFADAMTDSTFLQAPKNIDPRHFTGGYLYWKNDSDWTLYGTYDVSGHQCYLLPGEGHFCPVNSDDSQITWQLIAVNPYKVHPQALLHCQYLDRGDIQSGHQVAAATLVNPSTPAAGIGPGALPEGVTIGADDVTPETFVAGVLLPAAQVVAGTFAGAFSMSGLFTALNGITASAGKQIGVSNTASGGGITGKHAFSDPDLSTAYLDMLADRIRIVGGFQGAANQELLSVGLQNLDLLLHGTLSGATKISSDGATLTSDGSGNVTATSFNGPLHGTADHVPATGVTAGALTEGVTIGADDVGASGPNETFGAAAFLNPGQINAGALPSGVTIPGSQITGDLAANQVGPGALDADVTIGGGQVTSSVATAIAVDSTNAGSLTTPQLQTATANAGLSAKDNSGSSFVEIVPASPTGHGRGVQLDYQDTTNTLHAGLLVDDTGVTTMFGATKNGFGQVFHVSSFFSGSGSGTFSHGLGATPSWVGITSNVVNSTFTVGVDTVGASTVHVNQASGAGAFLGMATN